MQTAYGTKSTENQTSNNGDLISNTHDRIVKELLPAVKLKVSKEMAKNHNLTQAEIARRVGITQAAISKYLNGKYSKKLLYMESKINNMEIMHLTDEIMKGDKIKAQERVCGICYENFHKECAIRK